MKSVIVFLFFTLVAIASAEWLSGAFCPGEKHSVFYVNGNCKYSGFSESYVKVTCDSKTATTYDCFDDQCTNCIQQPTTRPLGGDSCYSCSKDYPDFSKYFNRSTGYFVQESYYKTCDGMPIFGQAVAQNQCVDYTVYTCSETQLMGFVWNNDKCQGWNYESVIQMPTACYSGVTNMASKIQCYRPKRH